MNLFTNLNISNNKMQCAHSKTISILSLEIIIIKSSSARIVFYWIGEALCIHLSLKIIFLWGYLKTVSRLKNQYIFYIKSTVTIYWVICFDYRQFGNVYRRTFITTSFSLPLRTTTSSWERGNTKRIKKSPAA